MRITLDARSLYGPETATGLCRRRLIEALAESDSDNDYEILAIRWRGAKAFYNGLAPYPNVRLAWLPLPPRLVGWLWHQHRFPLDLLMGTCDLFHGDHRLPPLKSCPMVVTIHDLSPWVLPRLFPQEYAFLRRQEFRGYEESLAPTIARSQMLLVDAQITKEELMEAFHVPEERVRVVPLGVDNIFIPGERGTISQDTALWRRYGLEQDRYLLYAGALNHRKNAISLVEASRLLKDRGLLKGIPLVICDGRGYEPMVRAFWERVHQLGLEDDVRCVGFVPRSELPGFYRGAIMLVHPSFYEGFGLTVLEAMACGTPVVAANASSLPEVVGDAGLLVDPYSVEGIAGAMQRLLEDSTLRASLRERGLQRARLFTWERTAQATLEVYRLFAWGEPSLKEP